MSDLMPWLAPWSGRLLALLLFTAGLAITYRALFRKSRDGRPRCPKCQYDLTGGVSPVCPECGYARIRRDRPGRPPRRYLLALVGLVIAFALPTYVVQRRVRQYGWKYYTTYGPFYYFWPTKERQRFEIGEYVFTVAEDRRPTYIATTRLAFRGSTVWEMTGDFYVDYGDREFGLKVDPGDDITGNGVPDLVAWNYSGGAHCCETFTIFELHPDGPRLLADIASGNSSVDFEDLDDDGDLEAILRDDTFAYWNACYAASPMPRVVLSYNGSEYAPDLNLMAADPPPPEVWEKLAKTARTCLTNNRGIAECPDLWRPMLDLIYGGHAELAWQFFDDAWPPDLPGKDTFITDFLAQLDQSLYRDALRVSDPNRP